MLAKRRQSGAVQLDMSHLQQGVVLKWGCQNTQPPMITVGHPGGKIFPVGDGIGATQAGCAVMSPTRAAGRFEMSTVMEPLAIMPGPAGTQGGGPAQGMVLSVARAAGMFAIKTVGAPGGISAKGRAG